ncbi:MAG: SDR family NAD(P)-dependent oxidoreductase, partial [Solirubrobacterales bacterium]
LTGKRVLISGASSGMGEEAARALAAAGAELTIVGRNEERLEANRAQIERDGATVHPIVRDLTDEGAPKEVVEEAAKAMGGIDVLVNVAGVMEIGSFEDHTPEMFDRMFGTNVRANFFVAQAAVPHLREAKGVMIFFSSIAAHMAFPDSTVYSATKGAIEGLMRQLTVELAPDIRVNAISPGEIVTPMNDAFYEDYPHFEDEAKEFTPAKRLGYPDDIAPTIVYLASDASKFVYGVSIVVDGGQVAR